jgi:hypothetical protein
VIYAKMVARTIAGAFGDVIVDTTLPDSVHLVAGTAGGQGVYHIVVCVAVGSPSRCRYHVGTLCECVGRQQAGLTPWSPGAS